MKNTYFCSRFINYDLPWQVDERIILLNPSGVRVSMEEKSTTSTGAHKTWKTMKQVTLRVPDQMVALIEQLAAHMPEVEIVEREELSPDGDGLGDMDRRVAYAIEVLKHNGALRNPYDYTWIMVAIGDGAVKGMGAFRSPQSFMDYLHGIGVVHVPSRSTLSAWYGRVLGKYPEWEFIDTQDPQEILRRKNVVRQFLSAMK